MTTIKIEFTPITESLPERYKQVNVLMNTGEINVCFLGNWKAWKYFTADNNILPIIDKTPIAWAPINSICETI